MRISVVTISFNQGRFLESCIRSVLSQGQADLEYILVDPGSTDGSREIINKYASRLSRIILEPDDGPADGLNHGFAYATGDVLGYINADDLLMPGALAKVTEWFEADSNSDVIYGNGMLIDQQGNMLRRIFSTRWSLNGYIHGGCNIIQQSTFVRGDAFRRAGGFNVANKTCWDGELLVDLALTGARFSRRRDAIAAFRLHPGSISVSGRLHNQMVQDSARIFEKVTGRQRTWIDRRLVLPYRIWKLCSHPVATTVKLMQRIAS